MTALPTKRCARCKQRRALAVWFNRRHDGYRSVCKTCRRERDEELKAGAPRMTPGPRPVGQGRPTP